MSPQLFIIIAVLVAVVGITVGYYLRRVVALGKRETVEIEVKEMLLKAKEEAKRITLDAENKAVEVMQQTRVEAKEREEKLKKAEERLLKKDFIRKVTYYSSSELELYFFPAFASCVFQRTPSSSQPLTFSFRCLRGHSSWHRD